MSNEEIAEQIIAEAGRYAETAQKYLDVPGGAPSGKPVDSLRETLRVHYIFPAIPRDNPFFTDAVSALWFAAVLKDAEAREWTTRGDHEPAVEVRRENATQVIAEFRKKWCRDLLITPVQRVIMAKLFGGW